MSKIDLRNCKKGDILISSQGSTLEYVSPTPWKHYTYLDHVVKYIEDKDGNSMGEENYGTRTHDGFTYANNRMPETDHDIIEVLCITEQRQAVKGKAFNKLLKIYHPKANWKPDSFSRDESYAEQREYEVRVIFEDYFKELEIINQKKIKHELSRNGRTY